MSRQKQFRAARDVDPEDEPRLRSDDSASENSDGDGGHDTGREHYESVGKSKLRKPEQPALGAKYSGSAVSRASLLGGAGNDDDDDDDEDPFAVPDRRVDGSGSSASGASASEHTDEDSEEDEDAGQGDDFDDSDSLSDDDSDSRSDDDDDDDDDDGDERTVRHRPSSDREKLKQLSKSHDHDASTVAASLTRAVKAEVQKGRAIQKQQAIYDRLLDSRIKLQKALTASNELAAVAADLSAEEMKEAARKAEAAALSLCSTIDSIRAQLDAPLRSSTQNTSSSPSPSLVRAKRAREADAEPDGHAVVDLLPTLWEKFQSLEGQVASERGNVLKKWSATTRATGGGGAGAAPASASDGELIDMLDSHIATESAARSSVYTDTSFYQSLLRDLIASRDKSWASADAISAAAATVPVKLHPSGSSKKAVDTRASKGRKIRYTVHERLQNFMAPDERITWTNAARREFFASLFGQHLLNDESGIDGQEEQAADDQAAVDPQEAGLRLFRTS